MRLTLKNILEKNGMEVVGEAENDVESVEKYKELKPDFVTMDIIMPVESGLKAVKNICEFDPNAKVIIVSAMGQESIVQESMKLGAKGFIVKPIRENKLLAIFNKLS
jgi:two-component system chemotaxis response regulator CheY